MDNATLVNTTATTITNMTSSVTTEATNMTSSPDEEYYPPIQIDLSNTIEAYNSSMASIGVVIALSILIIILNAIEISLILKRWKAVTQFEIVLLNLAFADILVGIIYLILTSIELRDFVKNTTDYKLYTAVFNFGIFSVTTSTSFVIVIGVERLSAVKTPLKHRARVAGKKKMLAYMSVVWVLSITTTLSMSLADHFIHKDNIFVTIGSRNLAITLSTFLFVAIAVIMILYSLIAYSMLNRSSAFLKYDKEDPINPQAIIDIMRKEKATIIACGLVMGSYLVCNVPFAVTLALIKVKKAQTGLMLCNSLVNPLIYFFKGYAEKHIKCQSVVSTRGRRTSKMRKSDSKDSLSTTVLENFQIKENSA